MTNKPAAWQQPITLFLVGQLVTAAGTYAAIRADLREAMVTAHAAEASAKTANERIDRMQERGR